MIKPIKGDLCHEILREETKPALAFDEKGDLATQRAALRAKLRELLGLDRIETNTCPLNIDFEETVECDGYRRIRFTFDSERGATVPVYLLLPNDAPRPLPLAIILQGHTTGFHNSIGVAKYEGDAKPNDQFGVQAVREGYAALCIEQRAMGETRSPRYPGPGGVHACSFTFLSGLAFGRTTIGERVHDVRRALDTMEELALPEIDLCRIMITGNSGGGTATYYATCLDERIGFAAPSCAFCSYKTSILDILHCTCNFIPSASLYFEMEDLAALIAPRRLMICTGVLDDIFPIAGVCEAYAGVEKIYKCAGAPDACRLLEMPQGHYFCDDLVWPAVREETEKLGWWG